MYLFKKYLRDKESYCENYRDHKTGQEVGVMFPKVATKEAGKVVAWSC